ncbi:hypothetical protein [Gaoshiqia sediminis]|uniref:Uncharacterized protein n=1 Tax=Gaoshiqia sediminis TaxID=2986998 RepID=A0AA41Y633_9BACT|nr:hypothetical protein [Gaoshiqia sediminis]MCW0482604.1 hypothetical protein [Gaoshiqia sediminis]
MSDKCRLILILKKLILKNIAIICLFWMANYQNGYKMAVFQDRRVGWRLKIAWFFRVSFLPDRERLSKKEPALLVVSPDGAG